MQYGYPQLSLLIITLVPTKKEKSLENNFPLFFKKPTKME